MAEKKVLELLVKIPPMIKQCPWRTGILILGTLNLVYSIYETFSRIKYTEYPDGPFDFRDDWFQMGYLEFRYWNTKAVKVPWLMVNVACVIGLVLKNPALLQLYIGFSAALVTIISAGIIRQNRTAQYYLLFDLVRITVISIIYYIYADRLENNHEDKVESPDEVVFLQNSSDNEESDEKNAVKIGIA